jgi:DNA-binding CsgD family transcriptional regulator
MRSGMSSVGNVGAQAGAGPMSSGQLVSARAPSRAPAAGSAHAPRPGGRPRFGWSALTPTELQVARMVAEGHSNRSVAAALCISPNTVSTHLRSAFAKLDVRSRVRLTRVVLEHDR